MLFQLKSLFLQSLQPSINKIRETKEGAKHNVYCKAEDSEKSAKLFKCCAIYVKNWTAGKAKLIQQKIGENRPHTHL